MDKIQPVNILLVTYQRIHFLERTIKAIRARTFYPNQVLVIDNGSTDGTKEYLKHQKVVGNIADHVFLSENIGQPQALNELFKFMLERDEKRPTQDYFVTTQDDLIPPDLRPCWLERLVHLMQKHEPDYGSVCMRIERTARLEWDERDDIIENHKTMPSVFRIAKKSDMIKAGDRPYGRLRHWESHTFADTMKFKLKKKFGMAVSLYASHIGFMAENKGYKGGFIGYYTYSKERVKQGEGKPYPRIDPKTNIPLEIKHGADTPEHKQREEYWANAGIQPERESRRKLVQRQLLRKYCEEGTCLDIGCGWEKCHPNCIGIDVYPYPSGSVDILHSGADLWMFQDGEVDSIVACHILEHFVDTKSVLREWGRVLKPGGIIALIIPDGERSPRTIREVSHKVALNKQIMRQILYRMMGYKILRMEDIPDLPRQTSAFICVAQKRDEKENTI